MINLAHVHLLLNHIPVLGSVFSLLFLSYAYIRKSQELTKTALGIVIIIALMTIPTYFTGEPAEEIIEKMPGIEKELIHEHEESAEYAFIGILILGAVCLGGLFYFRHKSSIPQGFTITVILLTLIICGIMARTAHLGGLIQHPETRQEFVVHEEED